MIPLNGSKHKEWCEQCATYDDVVLTELSNGMTHWLCPNCYDFIESVIKRQGN